MKSMFDLTAEFNALLQTAERGFDEETGEVLEGEALDAAFDALVMEAEDKVVGTGFVLNRLKADAEAVDAEIKRLTARRDSLRNGRERLADKLRNFMKITGTLRAKTPYISVSLGKPALSVVIDKLDEVPRQLCRVVYQPEKAAIKKQLEAGEAVPGVRLEPGKPRLTIR